MIFGCSIYWKIIFLELWRQFCIRQTGPIFGVKFNLHIYKTVKDFQIFFLSDIHSLCKWVYNEKNQRSLSCFWEEIFKFKFRYFFENFGYTYRADCRSKVKFKPLTELWYLVCGLSYLHFKKHRFRRPCTKLLPPTGVTVMESLQ